MADTPADDKDKVEDNQDLQEDNQDVQLHSATFDPLKALYSDNVQVPKPGAPKFDNLAVFATKLKLSAKPMETKREKEDKEKEKAAEVASKRFSDCPGNIYYIVY